MRRKNLNIINHTRYQLISKLRACKKKDNKAHTRIYKEKRKMKRRR